MWVSHTERLGRISGALEPFSADARGPGAAARGPADEGGAGLREGEEPVPAEVEERADEREAVHAGAFPKSEIFSQEYLSKLQH